MSKIYGCLPEKLQLPAWTFYCMTPLQLGGLIILSSIQSITRSQW